MNRPPIEVFYAAHGWRIVVRCPEFSIESHALPGRDEAETWITRAVAKALDMHAEDLVLKHFATGDLPK